MSGPGARIAQVAGRWRTHLLLISSLVAGSAKMAVAGTLGGAPDDDISLWRVGGALLLCIALGVAAIFVLRARMGYREWPLLIGKRDCRLKVVETLRLSGRTSLLLVVCDEKELLILSSEQTAQFVAHLPELSPSKAQVPGKGP